MRPRRSLLALSALGLVAAVGATGGSGVAVAAGGAPAVRELVGTFRLTAGSCPNGQPSGSYLAVTFGTRAIRNSSSSCGRGAVTLLSPGRTGLSTHHFTSSISAPTRFNGQDLSLGTAAQHVFVPPRIYLIGHHIAADLRSLQVAYHGGEWTVGAEQATGSYDARTHRLALHWFSGQSFTSASAGTELHLSGHFAGVARTLPQGTTVDLGTASFASGNPRAVFRSAADASARGATGAGHTDRRGRRQALRLAAHRASATTGSPHTFLVAEVLVLLNLVAFVTLSRHRGRR